MTFTTDDVYITIKKRLGFSQKFRFPFDDSQIYEWARDEPFTMMNESLPFTLGDISEMNDSDFNRLNHVLETLANSDFKILSMYQMKQFIDGTLGCWHNLNEETLNDYMLIPARDPEDMALSYANVAGDTDSILRSLPGDIDAYLDWHKIGQTLIDSDQVTEIQGAYIAEV
ncbi:hypothetical protein JOC36_000928 [Weissella uvarum]|uniref:hypothetical protein n=1 Tax=Weissella uvarum TaxID=1479233 RepID=UPI00195FCDCB|nr:hypothetical protein [Weissella uvarum]MBM7617371.1 hypothetical protein [Weissella uvarum]MCM0595743.1 hypothetical protein [Weissella uvarum]